MALTDEARNAKNSYFREWRKRNPDRVKTAQDRYWQRKAEQTKKGKQ